MAVRLTSVLMLTAAVAWALWQLLRVMGGAECRELLAAVGAVLVSLLRLCRSDEATSANRQLAAAIASVMAQLTAGPAAATAAPLTHPSSAAPAACDASFVVWVDLLLYLQLLKSSLHLSATQAAATTAMVRRKDEALLTLWLQWEPEIKTAMATLRCEDADPVQRESRCYRLEGEDDKEAMMDGASPPSVHGVFVQQLQQLICHSGGGVER